MAFADLPKNREGPTAKWFGHIFDRVCRENGIEHNLTKPYHPWTNGQADGQGLSLSQPRELEGARPRLRGRLQLCQAPQGLAMANAIRVHLQSLGERSFSLRDQSASPHPGTKHLITSRRIFSVGRSAAREMLPSIC